MSGRAISPAGEARNTRPPAVASPVQPGQVIAGKYRVDRVIGSGGMGVILGATHLQLEQPIAIKFMSPDLVSSKEGVRRFIQEARAAARIKSEHVARVHDVAAHDDGTPYIVMEYLEGIDLDHLLLERGSLPVEEAVEYVLQACEALAEAHVAGIVHRDLKPGNLFRCTRADGSALIKVLDFGISKLVPRPGVIPPEAWQTKSRGIMGSPLYLSPEQMRAPKDVDARADIWALGAILFELVVGATPFFGETVPEICAAILDMPLPRPSKIKPELPAEFDAALERMLEKDQRRRLATLAEVAEVLGPLAGPRAQVSVERIVGVIRSAGKGTPPPPSGQPVSHKVVVLGPVARHSDETRLASDGEEPSADARAVAGLARPASVSAPEERQAPASASVTLLTGERNLVRPSPGPVVMALAGAAVAVLGVLAWWLFAGSRAPTATGEPTAASTSTAISTTTATTTATTTVGSTSTATPTDPAPSSAIPTIPASALPTAKSPPHAEPRVLPPAPPPPVPPPPTPPPSTSTRRPDTQGFGKGLQ